VLHNDQHGIRVSWSAHEPESNVDGFFVAIGTTDSRESVLRFTEFGTESTAYINNIFFELSNRPDSALTTLFVISVKAINSAGLVSEIGESKHIFVQKANVPGIVFDGNKLYEDVSFTNDHTSVSASFYGFESEACNIISYDWAIGRTEYGTDVMTYTEYGLVMNNNSHGQAQIHLELYEDVKYFVSVRAATGCAGQYIVSCSDGIILDRKAPEVSFNIIPENDTTIISLGNVIYQAGSDSLNLIGNVSDRNGITETEWGLGTLPSLTDQLVYTSELTEITNVAQLVPGQSVFLTAHSTDQAGNINVSSSFAIVTDTTAPFINGLDCVKYVSIRKPVVTCSWDSLFENESRLASMTVSITNGGINQEQFVAHTVHASEYLFSFDMYDTIKENTNITYMSVTIIVTNIVGFSKTYGRNILVDRTPPTAQGLDVVTSTVPGEFADFHQKCQMPRRYVEVRLKGYNDTESGIDTSRLAFHCFTKLNIQINTL